MTSPDAFRSPDLLGRDPTARDKQARAAREHLEREGQLPIDFAPQITPAQAAVFD